jgi:hypothetical protein
VSYPKLNEQKCPQFMFRNFMLIILLQRDLVMPPLDDGLLEIVGFKDAWHGLVLLCPKGHGTRLAQVRTA